MTTDTISRDVQYHVRVFRTGQCGIKGQYAYANYGQDQNHVFTLYISVIQGNGITALVDTGMASVTDMNHMAGFLMSDLITQAPDESLDGILRKAGITADDIDYIFLTHCHYDHCSNLPKFPNAKVVIPDYAWRSWHENEDTAVYLHPGFLKYLQSLHTQGLLILQDEGEVLPGLGVRWVGGHSICSQFIYVNTEIGVAAFTGDTVQMYGNLEHDDIIAIHGDDEQCRAALGIARETADVLIPGHDPRVLVRFPDGIVA